MCATVGAPFFSVHCGFAFEVEPSSLGKNLTEAPRFSINSAKNMFIESIRILCDFAQSLGISIAVENNVVSPMNLVNGENILLLGVTSDDLLDIAESVNRNNLGFLIDVGHLKISAKSLCFDPKQFFNDIGDRIIAFHLSDNNGIFDTNEIFDEKAWFLPEIQQFLECHTVIETYKLSPEQLKKEITLVKSL